MSPCAVVLGPSTEIDSRQGICQTALPARGSAVEVSAGQTVSNERLMLWSQQREGMMNCKEMFKMVEFGKSTSRLRLLQQAEASY